MGSDYYLQRHIPLVKGEPGFQEEETEDQKSKQLVLGLCGYELENNLSEPVILRAKFIIRVHPRDMNGIILDALLNYFKKIVIDLENE